MTKVSNCGKIQLLTRVHFTRSTCSHVQKQCSFNLFNKFGSSISFKDNIYRHFNQDNEGNWIWTLNYRSQHLSSSSCDKLRFTRKIDELWQSTQLESHSSAIYRIRTLLLKSTDTKIQQKFCNPMILRQAEKYQQELAETT